MEIQIGTEVAGFRIEELVGRGGMGVVYRAEQLRLQRKVALKVLAPELAADPGFRQRFLRESQHAAQLQHPNIVTVFDAGETDGLLYLAMQFVRGTDLATELRGQPVLDPQYALHLLEGVGTALDFAHRGGLIHRDVKPGNVLITSERSYLTDFGLTKRIAASTRFTATGEVLGTLDYMAPEQIRGGDLDGRVDVYALACVLYECLVGTVPFSKDSQIAIMYAHLEDPAPRLRERRPELPEALDEAITRAMSKNPADRFPTCAALMAAARGAGLPDAATAARQRPAPPAEATPTTPAAQPTTPAPITAGTEPLPGAAGTEPLRETAGTEALRGPGTAAEPARAAAPAGAPPTPARRRSRLPLVATLLGLAMVAVVAAVLLAGGGDEGGGGGSGGGGGGDGGGSLQVTSIPVGTQPFGTTAGDGGIWVANNGDDTVSRVDPDASKGQAFPVGREPFWPKVAGGICWVPNSGEESVTPLDAESGDPRGPAIPVGNYPIGVEVAGGSAWVTNGRDGTVTRIDTGSMEPVGDPIPVGDAPRGIAAAGENLFVVNSGSGTVTRIDLATGEPAGDDVPVGEDPNGIAIGEGSVWVTSKHDDVVYRLDAATGEPQGDPIEVGDAPLGVAFGEGAVWIVNSREGTVSRLDPKSGEPLGEPVEVGGRPNTATVGFGAVWVTNARDHGLARIEP